MGHARACGVRRLATAKSSASPRVFGASSRRLSLWAPFFLDTPPLASPSPLNLPLNLPWQPLPSAPALLISRGLQPPLDFPTHHCHPRWLEHHPCHRSQTRLLQMTRTSAPTTKPTPWRLLSQSLGLSTEIWGKSSGGSTRITRCVTYSTVSPQGDSGNATLSTQKTIHGPSMVPLRGSTSRKRRRSRQPSLNNLTIPSTIRASLLFSVSPTF